MPSAVYYHCPCDARHPPSHSPSPSAPTYSLAHPPPTPAANPAAAHAFHPLASLYFCDECDHIRCHRCVAVDIATYFCPNCLFEVPHASVKQSRNLCTRNCFNCPSCSHILSVVATDPDDNDATTDPNIGTPPYFLQCSFCFWDSKQIGQVFDKPTGLGRQLDKLEQSAPDLLELYHLRDHFDSYIKAQADAAAAAAALQQSRIAARAAAAAAASASSASGAKGGSRARPRASNAASAAAGGGPSSGASAALQKSKLLRDIPQLASNGRYLTGVAEKSRTQQRRTDESEELRPYEAFTSWISGRTSTKADAQQNGVLGRREEARYDFLASYRAPDASQVTTLAQRWTSAWDQPVRTADLHPTRVALRCKQSKRCPACRHIIIKPDLKAESRRFKIKLVASHFVPDVELELAAHQPFLYPAGGSGSGASAAGMGGGSVGLAGSRLSRRTSLFGLSSGGGSGSGIGASASGGSTGSLRRRPMSVLGSGSGTGGSGSVGAGGSSFIGAGHEAVDEESLQPGRTYVFEATFTNPLDDAIRIRLGIARIHPPSTAATTGSGTSPSPPPPPILPELEPSEADRSNSHEAGSKPSWSVVPSTTSFKLHAYNEVWDLDGGADLLGPTDRDSEEEEEEVDDDEDVGGGGVQGEEDLLEQDEDEESFFDAPSSATAPMDGEKRSSSSPSKPSSRRTGVVAPPTTARRSGIIRRKGHSTTISFTLTLSPTAKEGIDLQLPLLVSYTSLPESFSLPPSKTTSSGEGSKEESFSFWTLLRFGRVGIVKVEGGKVKAKKAGLEKRRSVLGLGGAAGQAVSAAASASASASASAASPSASGFAAAGSAGPASEAAVAQKGGAAAGTEGTAGTTEGTEATTDGSRLSIRSTVEDPTASGDGGSGGGDGGNGGVPPSVPEANEDAGSGTGVEEEDDGGVGRDE